MISPSAWLELLQEELDVARTGDDPGSVHRMRVAAGRLRVWLELGDRRALIDDLRWLRRSAGEVRDLDVLIAETTDPECASWLVERRVAAQRQLIDALADERVGALLAALAWMPPLPRAHARRNVARLLKRALRAGTRIERAPTDVSAWHRLRRSLRRLRYAREWLDENTDELRDFLDVLGDLNNRVVESRELAECPANGAAAARTAADRKIETQCEAAAVAWTKLRAKLEAG